MDTAHSFFFFDRTGHIQHNKVVYLSDHVHASRGTNPLTSMNRTVKEKQIRRASSCLNLPTRNNQLLIN